MNQWQRDEQARALAAALRAQRARIEALVEESEERDRRERALAGALQELEQRLARVERRNVELEGELRRARHARRIPVATAARRLGLSPASIRRLIESGDLRGAGLRLPDRERRAWVVDLPDLERLEREAGAVGAPGTAKPASAGHRGSTTKG